MTDPLTDALRSVRLAGGIFVGASFTAPWSVTSCASIENLRHFGVRTTGVIAYHYVVEGALLLGFEGDDMIEVKAGEIVMFPRNDCHSMASGRGLRPVVADSLVRTAVDEGFVRIEYGGGGARTQLICGFLASEEESPLLAMLPRLLKIDVRAAAARDWVESSLRFAASELAEGRVAANPVLARLSEILFVEAVRQWAGSSSEDEAAWLRGIKDPQVARALALIYGAVENPHSADDLARQVAMSRSAFMDRFTALVGMPPIRYQTLWRMTTAKQYLRETRRSVAQVAYAIGYESEEAFSRAFKREFGMAPSRWRNELSEPLAIPA
jgi:AraC-like DNA-binding protein